MNVVLASDHRFDRTPDGAVWTQTMYAYSFWRIYLDVFDQVRVVARVREVPSAAPDWEQADGDRVSFVAVPYYVGPWQYLVRSGQVKRAARKGVTPTDAVILILGSQLANCIEPFLRKTGHPYGVEVIGDPYDTFAPGAFRHPLRMFLRWWTPRNLRRQCVGACAASYVTEFALQRRYPPAPGAYSTYYSNIVLTEEALVSAPRAAPNTTGPFTLITVGSLNHFYKAQDILVEAVALCQQQGGDLRLVLVGDGSYRPLLEARVQELGLGERTHFTGQLTAGEAVCAQLDQADLFVLPSRQEGLPRAMVEAMARGLPAIGSTVGGFPELLPPEDLVPPGDAVALAAKIREVLSNPARLARMSARNLERAKNYRDELLRERRVAFYRYVRAKTEEWLKVQGR